MALAHSSPAPCERAELAHAECREVADASCRRWALVVAVLGSSLVFIEGSVVNVALPSLQADLGLAAAEAQWVINAYLLPLSGLMLLGGSLGDRYGVARIYALGIGLFGLAALGAGLAPDPGWLIAARVVQGVGGALLVPSSLALIGRVFPEDERGAAIGTWAGFSALTTALGPVLGGWLTDAWHWRGVFLIMPLPALAAAWLALSRVTVEGRGRRRPTDWAGAALAVAALGGVSLGFILVPERGWGSPVVVAALALGAAAGVAFVLVETRREDPLLPLRLFRSRRFSGANAATLLLYAALNASLFLLPFLLIHARGFSPTAAGAAFLPFSLVMGAGSRFAGKWLVGSGAGRYLAAGAAVTGVGMGWLAAARTGSFWIDVLPAMLLMGVGMTVAVPPLTTIAMNSAGEEDAGSAAGVNNTVARVAGLLAIAVLGSLAVGRYQARLEAELQTIQLPAEARSAVVAGSDELLAAELPESVPEARRRRVEAVRHRAFEEAFGWTLAAAAGLAWAAALVSLLTLGGSSPPVTGPSRPRSTRPSPRRARPT
jgi:EmrB/QacA subfamily drug resistance transporter